MIINKLKSFFTDVKKKSSGTRVFNTDGWFTSNSFDMDLENPDLRKPYEQSLWINTAISRTAENISAVPFKIIEKGAIETKADFIEEGDLAAVFRNPNSLMDSKQLFEATLVYFGLFGEVMWILERDNISQVPKSIWPVSPEHFEPVVNEKNNDVTGWFYKIDKKVIPSHNVIQFKVFNPDNVLRGLSPLASVMVSVNQDFYSARYNQNFFKQGARPSGVIEVEDELGDSSYRRLIDTFEERHSGYKKAHRVALIEGGGKYKPITSSFLDMDFVKLRAMTRKEILTAFKINEVVLGYFEDVKSYEGSKVAHSIYWRDGLLPTIKKVEGVLWSQFFSKINGGKLRGIFDLADVPALRIDFSAKVRDAKDLVSMGYTLNDVNKRLDLGFDDVSYGDTPRIPSNIIPINDNPDNTDPKNPRGRPAQTDPPEEGGPDTIDEPDKNDPLTPDRNKVKKETTIKRVSPLPLVIDLEKRFASKFKKFIFDQRMRVLSDFSNTFKSLKNSKANEKGISDLFLEPNTEAANLKNILEPLYVEGTELAVEDVLDELNEELLFNFSDPDYSNPISIRLVTVPLIVVLTIKGQLNNTLVEGLNNNESLDELADRIKRVYNKASNRAASAMATTEATTTVNGARFGTFKKLGVVKHKWFTVNDDLVRDKHVLMHGAVAAIGTTFRRSDGSQSPLRYPGDSRAPAEEIINCRCFTVAV